MYHTHTVGLICTYQHGKIKWNLTEKKKKKNVRKNKMLTQYEYNGLLLRQKVLVEQRKDGPHVHTCTYLCMNVCTHRPHITSTPLFLLPVRICDFYDKLVTTQHLSPGKTSQNREHSNLEMHSSDIGYSDDAVDHLGKEKKRRLSLSHKVI